MQYKGIAMFVRLTKDIFIQVIGILSMDKGHLIFIASLKILNLLFTDKIHNLKMNSRSNYCIATSRLVMFDV
jgi:hypothetical protein